MVATITQLVAQKNNNERITVYVDDDFFCGLAIDDVVRNSLVVGMDITEAELSNLLGLAGENDMFNKALVYILRNPRTEVEIRRFLSRKKDCSPEMIARIIERLKTMNYINDEAYAKMFAATKHVKMSIRSIKHKLKTKGIKNELADAATEDTGNQGNLARTVAEKYMRYREYDDKNLQRLYRYLVSKGFEYDDVGEILKEYKNKREIDPEKRAEYKNCHDEYRHAKEQLKHAKTEARCAKKQYKVVKKRIVGEMP